MKKGWDIPFSYYIKIKWSTRVSYSFNSASDYSSNVWKVSKYGIFPVHIFLYSNWIRSNYRPMHFWCHGTTLKKIFSIEKLNWTWNKETNFNKLGRFFSRVFQIALRGRGWGWEICPGGIFLSGGGSLTWSDFDHSNLLRSWTQHSVNIDHLLKSKLAWPVYTGNMKLK